MKLMTQLAVLAAVGIVGLTPLSASAQATANAGSIADSAAQAINNVGGGRSIGSASIGGDGCANTVIVGPLGISKAMKECAMITLIDNMADSRAWTYDETRAMSFAVAESLGYRMTYEQRQVVQRPAAASTRNAPRQQVAAAAQTGIPMLVCRKGPGNVVYTKHVRGASAEQIARGDRACARSLGY